MERCWHEQQIGADHGRGPLYIVCVATYDNKSDQEQEDDTETQGSTPRCGRQGGEREGEKIPQAAVKILPGTKVARQISENSCPNTHNIGEVPKHKCGAETARKAPVLPGVEGWKEYGRIQFNQGRQTKPHASPTRSGRQTCLQDEQEKG